MSEGVDSVGGLDGPSGVGEDGTTVDADAADKTGALVGGALLVVLVVLVVLGVALDEMRGRACGVVVHRRIGTGPCTQE